MKSLSGEMGLASVIKRQRLNVTLYGTMLVVCWTLLCCALLAWNRHQHRLNSMMNANGEAQISFRKDLIYRLWASSHGGVYVKVTEQSPPNPYLTVPDRDLTTTTGMKLTLINPAYVIRQANEIGEDRFVLRSKLTSLNPINPGNAADPWEAENLRRFEADRTTGQAVSIFERDGEHSATRRAR